MSNICLLSYYLGFEVEQKHERITLKQTTYAKKLLQQFGMEDFNPYKCPMEQKCSYGKIKMVKWWIQLNIGK